MQIENSGSTFKVGDKVREKNGNLALKEHWDYFWKNNYPDIECDGTFYITRVVSNGGLAKDYVYYSVVPDGYGPSIGEEWLEKIPDPPKEYAIGFIDNENRVVVSGTKGISNIRFTLEEAREEISNIINNRQTKANEGNEPSKKPLVIIEIKEIYDINIKEKKVYSLTASKRD